MSRQIIYLTDPIVSWLRARGWVIKAPHFVDGRPVYTITRR